MNSYFIALFSVATFFVLTFSFSLFSTNIILKGSTKSRPFRKLNSFFGKFTPFFSSEAQTGNEMNSDIFTNLPTWETLGSLLAVKGTELESREAILQKVGRGVSNHKSNIRLFDAPEDFEPEITFYRDTAAWCPYCEKVWLQLEEKRIPYRVQKVPLRCYGEKPSSFMKINPSGGLPVATIKGRTMAESNDIMMAIEREFPSFNPLLPAKDSKEFQRVAPLMKLERRVFSVWFQWLTSPADASSEMTAVLRQLDSELAVSGGPYLLGASLSFVDLLFVPFLERMAASLPYFKGFESRSSRFPELLKWYEAMDSRPAYQGIKSDYYTHCHDLPPQIGRCFSLPAAEPFANRIDGGDWLLSVPAESCFEPMFPSDPDLADRAAARALLSNYEAVVKFCSRSVSLAKGRSGMTVSAPLADPYVREDTASLPAIDAALRHIVHSMLSPIDPSTAEKISWSTSLNPEPFQVGSAQKTGLVASLFYLRDRVGVPRDMSVHAAKRLRAHINNFVDKHLVTNT